LNLFRDTRRPPVENAVLRLNENGSHINSGMGELDGFKVVRYGIEEGILRRRIEQNEDNVQEHGVGRAAGSRSQLRPRMAMFVQVG